MSVSEMNLPVIGRENTLFNNRFLGTVALLGAPMLFIETVLRVGNILPQNSDNAWVGLLEMFYIIGWTASTVGMRRLRVTGDGTGARVLFAVQIFGLTMAFLFGAQVFFGAIFEKQYQTLFFKITDIFFPFSHLLMLVVGVFVWRASVWRGAIKFAPFLVGIVLALFMGGDFFSVPFGAAVFAASMAIGLFGLAFAVRRNPKSNDAI